MSAGFSTGQHIGDYEIISILGAGGMGKVYKVRNVISERVEAMKILLPDLTSNQSLADRFLREIRLLATLHHPNIAALRTALTYENQLVMIIEYVEGETLANRVARAPMSTAEVVNYRRPVPRRPQLRAQTKHHSPRHQARQHDDHARRRVKLMDFGIARLRTRKARSPPLAPRSARSTTCRRASPRRIRRRAFRHLLFRRLALRNAHRQAPFDTDSQYALMTAQLNTDPPPPITIRGDLPPALNQIILMCMAKDPDRRFQSADALRAALKTVPVSALPPAEPPPFRESDRRQLRARGRHSRTRFDSSATRSSTGRPRARRRPPAPVPAQAQAPTPQPTSAPPACRRAAASMLRHRRRVRPQHSPRPMARDRLSRRRQRPARRRHLHPAPHGHSCRTRAPAPIRPRRRQRPHRHPILPRLRPHRPQPPAQRPRQLRLTRLHPGSWRRRLRR